MKSASIVPYGITQPLMTELKRTILAHGRISRLPISHALCVCVCVCLFPIHGQQQWMNNKTVNEWLDEWMNSNGWVKCV